ncbi:GNAT family N-acetyltransferase [Fictibacillus phosphorivorans]|uniref:GNAT family N-acetyltransferase n=1 Tax=Fictibacillus phosphorivorans TaxID=1221500 RepID=UPI00204040BD|nr:GNAT family N-acetyltransferase [Fictibacillus phosphorivorans]MCM3719418.1 GNAT family N-acetyltransferase [Fictibacillus phosphorivorans]MCM3777104.1 GNAT family N-acetyltransferase [Fictibacillus phosphorivorans]
MLVIKRFDEISYKEAITLWNESWKHYFSDMTMDLNRFLQKVTGEGISLEHSVVAVYEGKLAGFALNSFRTINGKRFVWNGGTAIAPDFRGMGIGEKLIQACLEIYEEQNVDFARLEAIKENEKAIKLYEKMGYQTFEELSFLLHEGEISVIQGSSSNVVVKNATIQEVLSLSFFEPLTAWQTQFQSLKDFSCALAVDGGRPVGYAVYKKSFKETGELAGIVLYQCAIDTKCDLEEETTANLINFAFAPEAGAIRRLTMNLPKKQDTLSRLLKKAGFTTFVEQVHMERPIKKGSRNKGSKNFFRID